MGWINLFFPYFIDEEGRPTRRNPWLSGDHDPDELLAPPPEPTPPRRSRARHDTPEPQAKGYVYESHYPSGLAKAPFIWERRDQEGNLRDRWNMEFLGGFVGVAQDPASLCLRPEIGWVVREAATVDGSQPAIGGWRGAERSERLAIQRGWP